MPNNRLETKDFFKTGERFTLLYNEELDLYKTNPLPTNLSPYYQSDNYISHTDNTKDSIAKLYAIVKNFTLSRKLKLISKYAKNRKTLLDIGAGTGDFLVRAKKENWNVSGVEPNQNARLKASEKNLYLQNKITDLKETYQVITLWHVLEHLPDLEKDITDIIARLHVEGTLLIAVPNYKSFDAAYYKEFWAAYDTPRHVWHFSKKSIQRIFEKHNLKLIKTKPMYFDSFYVSLLSEKYKNDTSNYIRAFCIGLWSNIKALVTKEYSSHIYILKRS